MTRLKTNFKKDDMVLVNWVDITTKTTWMDEEEAIKLLPDICTFIGFFLFIDDKYFRGSSVIDTNDRERDVTIIPIGCVHKIRKLKNV